MATPAEDEVPDGFQVVPDDALVKDGDVVLDYITAKGFAPITHGGTYHRLIGKNGYEARLDQLAFEVFQRVPERE